MAKIACDTVGPAPDSGSEDFIAHLERETDRILRKQKPEPKNNNQMQVHSRRSQRMSCVTRLSIALLAIAALSGCASTHKESGERFATAYDEASKTISANLDAQVKARRLLGVWRYLEGGEQDDNINSDVAESFARYVCAGEGDFAKQRAALGVLASYKKIIAKITETPDESVGMLWKSIQQNRAQRAPLTPPAESPEARAECIMTVGNLLKRGGLALAPATPEFVSALVSGYDGLKKLVDSLDALFVAGLKITDEMARAEALRSFVKQNRELIDGIFKDDLSDAALRPAYERRMEAALVSPHGQFATLYALNPKVPSDRAKILKVATTVHELLEPFDTLRLEAAPSEIAKAMAVAHKQLVDLAEGNISVKQAWAALGAIVQMLKDLDEAASNLKKQKKD